MDVPPIGRRFPLVSRPRPPCGSLQQRVAELATLAQDNDRLTGREQVTQASEVCNKAALIASDCGRPDLALKLCWRHYDAFVRHSPLPGWAARLALQPVLNIARLLIREGDGQAAYEILKELYDAVRYHEAAVIAGQRILPHRLTGRSEDAKAVGELVWTALLADGTRALAQAGRWQEAVAHAERHRGIGLHLLDGRQVAVLAAIDRGDLLQAVTLVDDSALTQPWEQPVASLLRIYCQRSAGPATPADVQTMLDQALKFLTVDDPLTTLFRVRVSLTALDLAEGFDGTDLRAAIVGSAALDAYASRDVLAHPLLQSTMTPRQIYDLNRLVAVAGLGSGLMPFVEAESLMASVTLAEDVLHNLLAPFPGPAND